MPVTAPQRGLAPGTSSANVRRQAKEGLDAIFAPRSVAVIGASPKPESVGFALMSSILDGGYKGKLFAVHPTVTEVLGRPAVARIGLVPGPVDLAIIAVPAASVVDVAKQCGEAGVRGLLVISAGFREADAEGAAREQALEKVVHESGMRMVGPNCLGVSNNSPGVRLNATFGSRPVLPGTTALVTQSGAVGIALMEHAAHVGLGLARFASMGNKTDVSGNDLLLLWEDDPEVHQVLFYLENFGNPRNFVNIARRITRTKPIVVLKSGRSPEGAKAAGSHTGALSQSDSLVDALLEQCGVLRAQSVEQLFDHACVLATQAPMTGPRVAIVTNSGGPAILAVDALNANGLQVAAFSPQTVRTLTGLLPSASHPVNPVDLLASGDAAMFEACLGAVAADPGVDGIIAIWTPLAPGATAQAEGIARALQATKKPGVAVLFGHGPGAPAFEHLKSARIPVFSFPENAVQAMVALRNVGVWRERGNEPPARPKPGRAQAAKILAATTKNPDGWLPTRAAMGVAMAYGLRFPRHAWAATPEEAEAAALSIGASVALKIEAPGLVHKSDAGGVRVGVAGANVATAVREMMAAVKQHGFAATGVLVMAMAPQAPEVLVGATQDALFGPVLACAAGGVYTEILKDAQVRLAPLLAGDAQRMVERLRMAPMLAGARGAAPGDVAALVDALECVAQMAVDFPEIQEFELNPLRVLPAGQGVLALDVRMRLRPKTG